MLYSAMLYKKESTNFNLVIGISESKSSNPNSPFSSNEGLTAEGRSQVSKFCEAIGANLTFEKIETSEPIFHSNDFRRNFAVMHHIPYASLVARLIMMMNASEEFLYLDVDLIMQPGWDELLTIEPVEKKTALMGVKNSMRINLDQRANPDHPQFWVMSDETNTDDYFNTGVMKFFPKAWKSEELSNKLILLLGRIESGELKVRFSDQDVLNPTVRNNFELLDKNFNVMVHTLSGDIVNTFALLNKSHHPKILHYTGNIKPNEFDEAYKDRVVHLIDHNCSHGFHDHAQNYFYIYFFIHNQRLLWERYN